VLKTANDSDEELMNLKHLLYLLSLLLILSVDFAIC